MRYPPIKISILWFSSIILLVITEWLFQITKPSFLSKFGLVRNIETALLVSLVLCLALLPLLALCLGLAATCRNRLLPRVVLLAIPSVLTAITLLLMLDNFTHTVFAFNMGSATGWWHLVYLFLLLALTANLLRKFDRLVLFSWPKAVICGFQVSAMGAVLLTLTILPGRWHVPVPEPAIPMVAGNGPRPNILIFSTDGLRAANMSVYGYRRPTTPFLESIADETLRFEGHFPNASHTTGSLMALLSGRHPTRTGIIYRPDIFRGIDSFRHLPGILRSLGYRNLDVSIDYYADPFDLNMRNAFDSANHRAERHVQFASDLPLPWQVRFDMEVFFTEHLVSRVLRRLAFTLGLTDLASPFFLVTHTGSENHLDENTLLQIKRLMDESPQPFFLHVHLLGTHGPKYGPPRRVFSRGETQDREWMNDFYDDAILAFDSYVAELFSHMKKRGLLDRTLVILTSDHGVQFTPWQAIPLILRYPWGDRNGVVAGPSQQIDVAPTILEYLGVSVPGWMDGRALAGSGSRPVEPVFSVAPGSLSKATGGWRESEKYSPPFYSLGFLGFIVGPTWYGFSFTDNTLYCRKADGLPDDNEEANTISGEQAQRMVLEYLEGSAYELPGLHPPANIENCSEK